VVDLVPGAGGALSPLLGGGPYNAARAAAREGAEVAFLGRISADALGRRLLDGLVADGVGIGSVVTTEDPTTLALAEIGDDGGAAYRFYVAGTSAPGLADADVALVVGTLGLVFEPSAGTLERLVGTVADDVLVVVDPNCRPAAVGDEEAYRARLERVFARADVIKASEEDLAWLVPGAGPEAAMRLLLGRRRGTAGIVTLGARGALVVPGARGAEPFAVPAPRVEVVDTIGAGDAFLGGWLAAWQRGAGLRDATEVAVRVAAAVCERAGA
jgi:fructokinase